MLMRDTALNSEPKRFGLIALILIKARPVRQLFVFASGAS